MAKAKVIIAAATFAYFISVFERSSMGIASLSATERFHVGAAALSTLAVAQLVVYAAMQIPTGLLLDRFGSKRLIATGSIITGVGNFIVAVAPILGFAVLGRMIVGLGDALIFVSGVRLIDSWVSRERATRLTQLYANIGQLGQVASAVPFAYLLGIAGWTPAFSVAASFAIAAAAMSLWLLADDPKGEGRAKSSRSVFGQLKENLADAYTRKAFWAHFTLQSSGSVFILLWGFPFLVEGEGLTKEMAGALLTSFVFIGFFVGPLLSRLYLRFPNQKHLVVAGVFSLIAISWLLILVTPGVNPLWQIILLVLALGMGGPASMIAFDYSRGNVPKYRLGSSNGIINSGGFVATFVGMFLVGTTLDLVHDSGILGKAPLYSLAAFKLAFPVLLIVISVGLFFFYRERNLTLRNKSDS